MRLTCTAVRCYPVCVITPSGLSLFAIAGATQFEAEPLLDHGLLAIAKGGTWVTALE